jgi:hypothetical protein
MVPYNSSSNKISYARHVWPLYGSEARLYSHVTKPLHETTAHSLRRQFDDFEGSDATLQSLVAGRPGALLSRKSLLDLARNPRIHVRNTDRALLFRFGLRIGSFDSVSISSMEFYLLIDAPAWLKKHSI